MEKVTVLMIETEDGPRISVHRSTEGADRELAAFGREYWINYFDAGTEPDSNSELIETFFQKYFDEDALGYSLETLEVQS